MTQENDTTEQLPSELVKHLKSADQAPTLITARADREILALAEAHFSARPPVWRRLPTWAAVAATLLVAVFVMQLRELPATDGATLYADVDQSGRIDIADVLAAARARDDEEQSQDELDAFAMRIVSLQLDEDAS